MKIDQSREKEISPEIDHPGIAGIYSVTDRRDQPPLGQKPCVPDPLRRREDQARVNEESPSMRFGVHPNRVNLAVEE